MEQIILFLFLVLFPFGQIIRIGILQPIDVLAGIGAFWAIYKKYREPAIFKYFKNFLFIAAFSYLFSALLFPQIEILYGLLYLLRLSAYFYFFVFVWNFANKSRKNKVLLLNSLLTISIASALFGWIQYFMFPSIRAFMEYGWDEHLFRIVGTFLDSSYISLIFVLGIIISVVQIVETKRKRYLALSFFLTLSLAFTYSRAGFLAFFGALILLWLYTIKTKLISVLALFMLAFIIFLPRPGGEGVKLERIASVSARLINYKETLRVFRTSPLFGVGYNNLCLARNKYVGIESFSSHSCSGSDSSLLFVLATTGAIGLPVFILMLANFWKSSGKIFRVSLLALLVHSLFANSFFYPWILGWTAVLLSISLRGKGDG